MAWFSDSEGIYVRNQTYTDGAHFSDRKSFLGDASMSDSAQTRLSAYPTMLTSWAVCSLKRSTSRLLDSETSTLSRSNSA